MKTDTLFRAGDVVDHLPTGERWQLAIDQIGPHVFPCGTPAVRAQASDCNLVTAASDEERIVMLTAISRADRRDVDFRSDHARGVIASEVPVEGLVAECAAWKDRAIAAMRELVEFINSSNAKKDMKARAVEILNSFEIKPAG